MEDGAPGPRGGRGAGRRPVLRGGIAGLLLAGVLTMPLGAQEAGSTGAAASTLRVFFECHTRGCDFTELRTDIDWVTWVRDRADAQLHVLVTSEETGSGGRSFRLDFIGVGSLAGTDDQFVYSSLGTDVQDETVLGLNRVVAVGLARYSLLTGAPVTLAVSADTPEVPDRLVAADEVEDPWDFWVFQVNMNAGFSGETSRRDDRVGGSVEAGRTTEDWKLDFRAGGNWRESRIELSDSTLVDTRRNWQVEGGAVHALARHWSAGVEARASASTAANRDLSAFVGPALEYSVWPYEEATRRSFRVRYRVGVEYFDYEEETVFEKLEETVGRQAVEVSISQRQPWGNVSANVEGSHYLHDLSQYRVSTGGFLSFRIVRGLSLRLDGRVSWIRDQIYLPAEGATDEEILLQRRDLASSFDWNLGMGFSFQFGSIYNNVVNNRF